MKRLNELKKILVLAAGIAVMSCATAFLLTGCKAEKGPGSLMLSGNIEVTEVDLGFKTPGRVEGLFKDEGESVKKGEGLARLDVGELEREAERAAAALLESETALKELRAGARPQERRASEADAAFAKAELEKAEKDFKRAEMLFREGAVSASYYDNSKKALDTARAKDTAAREMFSLVKEGARKEDIRAGELRVVQSEAALKAVEERLEDAALTSPIDGVVLRRNVEQGETVQAGAALFTIGDLARPWVKVYVKEDRLGEVRLGQKAEVAVDSFPGKAYEGTVSYISSEAEFTPKNVQTQEERVKLVFGMKVLVDNAGGELKPGMPADVRLTTR